LTGVLSRTILEETLELEFARACTLIHPLSLVLIDIDHFREVNAIIGHYQADQMLVSLADLIQSMLEKEDILGRFGGDEFILLLPGTQLEAAYQRAEKLRARVNKTFKTNGPASPKPVTISAGVACWPTHGENPTMLIRAVTLALEEAKKTRDQVALANLPARPMNFSDQSIEHLS
jgi:diguanylate cyclase (GGDEF)-like protein